MFLVKKIYIALVRRFLRLKSIFNNYYKFYVPNFKKIKRGDLKFRGLPVCHQKMILYGNGELNIGHNCVFGYRIGGHFHKGYIDIQLRDDNAKVSIGDNVSTNNNLLICAYNSIQIGDDTLIGLDVSILDHEAHGIAPDKRRQLGEIGTVKIGNNVWLGNNVTILKNTEIGNNTIVAAGAVVSGSFPANVYNRRNPG